MSALRIEHVNITVTDPERTARLLAGLFDWHVRWRGPARDGGTNIHIGSDSQYISLYGARPGAAPPGAGPTHPFAKGKPLNHIGVEVADLAAAEALVLAAGLQPFGHDSYEPGRRFYFFDQDGIEYELVSYAPHPPG
jgi:catechol 2,3-dioxygenase-like lactoylglutathione lyase family enzyme